MNKNEAAFLYPIQKKSALEAVALQDRFITEIRNYKANMFRIANGILRHYSDAEDAVSETVLIAYTKIHTLKNFDRFKPWIIKILIRECYRLHKKKPILSQTNDLPEIPVKDTYNTGELWRSVMQLDSKFKTIVLLYYYEDLTIKQISGILSIPQGTVKSRLTRAKAKLKQHLEAEGVTNYDGF